MTQPAILSADLSSTVSFRTFLDGLLVRFPERSRAIFGLRFGLDTGEEQTLEEIGQIYGITRERVRQVVDVMQKKMRLDLKRNVEAQVIERVEKALSEAYGIMPVVVLVTTLTHDERREAKALLALLTLFPGIVVIKESEDIKTSVSVTNFDQGAWRRLMRDVALMLKTAGDVMSFKELYALYTAQEKGSTVLTEAELRAAIAPSTLVEENVFGQYGLADWDTVRPRGTRERAHLILKVFAKPMHFREIARLIDEHGLYKSGKKTHPQTVHNELIKDKRFVLVGRGTYALSDWGYTRGTVRQVLATILKDKAEPMTREDLLKAVLKVRQVKKSTVIINLNSFFAKVGKNIYTLKEK